MQERVRACSSVLTGVICTSRRKDYWSFIKQRQQVHCPVFTVTGYCSRARKRYVVCLGNRFERFVTSCLQSTETGVTEA